MILKLDLQLDWGYGSREIASDLVSSISITLVVDLDEVLLVHCRTRRDRVEHVDLDLQRPVFKCRLRFRIPEYLTVPGIDISRL